MVQLKGMQVTLPARDVQGAARFYGEVLGFRILIKGPSRVILAQGDLRLSLIKAEPGLASSPQPVQLRFTVDAPQHVDEIAERVKQLGLPLLEEVRQQPDGTRAFACLGPDDHVIEISTELVQPPPVEPTPEAKPLPPTPEAAVPQSHAPVQPSDAPLPSVQEPTETRPTPTPTAASPSPSQTSVQPPVAPAGRPTRSDRYLLEAQERLAKIKEELASLSTSFSQTDIAGTLEEMKQKVAQRMIEVAERVASPTDQEADRERQRREAEEALARYKQVVAQEYPEPAKPAKPEEEGLKPVKKTLGPASDDKPPKE